MEREKLVRVLREKGPVFALGVAVGALAVFFFDRREAIARALRERLKRSKVSGEGRQ